MLILDKKIFLAALSTVFFLSVSYAMDPAQDQKTSHSVPAKVIEAVEKNKQRVLQKSPEEERSRASKYPYGVDIEGRHPGDKNYGAAESDFLIQSLISKGAQDITWGVVNFKAMSPKEMDHYMKAIYYTELW